METRAKGIRIPEEAIKKIEVRAARRGWNFNNWINWAIAQGLRSHSKRDGHDNQ